MGTRGGRPEPARTAAGSTAGRGGQQRRRGGVQGGRPVSSRPGNGRSGQSGGNGKPPAAARPAPAAAKEAPLSGPPAWFRWTTLVLAVIGLGVSIYLTIEHYTASTTLACSDNGAVNCLKVTTSPQSMVFGIFPVAVLGLAFYLFMVAVSTPWGWRSRWPVVHWARLASVIVGIVFVLYLVYVELFLVRAICLWCTSVHVVTFLLFVLTMAGAAAWGVSGAAAAREPGDR